MDDSPFTFKTRLLTLEPGMYIVRYASQDTAEEPCLISLQPAPIGKSSVDFFPGETVVRNTLSRLGDTLIVRVKNGAGTLLITEYQRADLPVRQVDLRVDRIDTSVDIIRSEQQRSAPVVASKALEVAARAERHGSPVVLKLIGHVQAQGDVTANEWVGNIDQEARLEGFAVVWPNKPQGVDIAYSCKVADVLQPAVLSGNFSGSRGKRAPITAVAMALVGPRRAEYVLDAQAVFAGCPPQDLVDGQEVTAQQGQAKLVALHVSITPRIEMNAARYQSPREDLTQTPLHSAQVTN
ncbi:cell wall-binding repeat 2 family protein [Pseudomonas psychrotolerans]|uniref:cell wall-binding repeat 2 family protein n=1 Tax=Pseudomonas oryzihabitans TaxID=47885 RepID=UPI0002FDB5FF|nr:cell wall-binding repeat 2 family protein [Pseudomonas psychrotolerans]MBA1180345.1 cell wall-binding repeat 2 family protein [Pseudomonas psychrotolerans]MBA1214385.1 cell wall-binding repeat 2 family protein [Pseudomonas psychrotolerans]